MDLRIVTTSILSFIFFLLIQTLIFHKIDKKEILVWIVKTCLIGGAFPLVFSIIFAFLFPINDYSFISQLLIVFFASFVLYSFLAVLYILGPFGLIESSLRLKLLSEIANAEEIGLKKQDLYKAYNINAIIQKRLERFVVSKDFIFQNGNYIIKNRFSYFLVHTFLFENMKKLYLSNNE
jgi:hypothetical protein